MQEPLFLTEFYDKSMIPIGEMDMTGLLRHGVMDDLTEITHWLIGLICNHSHQPNWKVVVYPICKNESYWKFPLFFSTDALHTFERTIEIARGLEKLAKEDALTKGIPSAMKEVQRSINV